MPHPLRTPDSPDSSPDRFPPQSHPDDKEKPAKPGSKAGGAANHPAGDQPPPPAGRKATLIKKLEDLHDREDLSERNLNDRNWQ